MTWQQYVDLFAALALKLRAQWKCAPPPYDTLPSEVLEVAVSAWCGELSKDLMADLEPPEIVRPWILVRVACAAAAAAQFVADGRTDAPALDGLGIRRLLIHEWQEALRDKWPLLLEPDNE